MDEETKDKIIKWLETNHSHHFKCDEEMPIEAKEGFDYCTDKDKPYVDSMELERFIKSL